MSILNKLAQIEQQRLALETQKKEIVRKRKEHIGTLAEKAKVLSLQDELLLGALIYARQVHETKDEIGLVRLRENAKPYRTKSAKPVATPVA